MSESKRAQYTLIPDVDRAAVFDYVKWPRAYGVGVRLSDSLSRMTSRIGGNA